MTEASETPHLRLGQSADGLATMLVTDRVEPKRVQDYERWVEGIHSALRKQPGFLAVDVVRNGGGEIQAEYLVLVKFDTEANMARWHGSETLRSWLGKQAEITSQPPEFQAATGLETFFDRKTAQPLAKPAFWKLVLLSTGCVYPLIMLLNWVLAPTVGSWPRDLQILIVVCALSVLLTWPVMPYATRLLRPWLYPGTT